MAGAAGVVFIAVTYLGIKALSWLGAIAAPLFIIAAGTAMAVAANNGDFGRITEFHGAGGGAMTFGVAVTTIMATFADSGTMTADFTRWSKNGRQAVWATATAFPVASLVAQLSGGVLVAAGAIASAETAGGDFTPILTGVGSPILNVLVVVFVVINLGSVCTHCLYNGALGWSHLVRSKMRLLTLVLGVIGVIVALLGAWDYFVNWLSILGVLVPPLGAVLIADQIILRGRLAGRAETRFRQTAFIAWAAGAAVALLVHVVAPSFSDAVVGLLVGLVVYLAVELPRKQVPQA
ncbi:cytosine permease [Saccharopolyspora sp. NPDC050642]|uniref:cytosine permease n=1 Tax=Saccharopolyspora sp. NPDC050642 TaxID=3157099 RepID=UPI0033CF6250